MPRFVFTCCLAAAAMFMSTARTLHAAVQRDTDKRALNLLVVNYDPALTNHGGVRLSRHLKWNNPHPMTTNLIRYIREASGGFADYKLVECQLRSRRGQRAAQLRSPL